MSRLYPEPCQGTSLAACLIWLLAAAGAHPATVLHDFETDADLTALRWVTQGGSALVRSDRFATAGQGSVRFTSPAWKAGMPESPAFELTPAVQDWTPYDRLVVDITNPDATRHGLSLFITDSKVPFRKGLSFTFEVSSPGFRRFIVPLSSFPKDVRREDIALLHFLTERPQNDLTLFLDNLILLRPEEVVPEPGAALARQVAAVTLEAVEAARQALHRSRTESVSQASALELQESARAQFDRIEAQLRNLRTDLASPDPTLSRLAEITSVLEGLPRRVERTKSVVRLQQACRAQGLSATNFLVGVATSMEKILPREALFEVEAARPISLNLARNEKESFQVAVLPVHTGLRHVRVDVSDLRSKDGVMLSRDQIYCEVVGYVQTLRKPPYPVSHVGWWPDPILDFLGPVDIAAGDLQTFWIRVRAPQTQPAGQYRGTLTVSAAGEAPVALDLNVRVYGFILPDHSPLPVAITFAPHDHPTRATLPEQSQWRQSPDYPVHAWRRHKLRWADFLADYYINYDSLYRHGPPDFEIVKHLRDQGRLVAFNLGSFDRVATGGEAGRNAVASLRSAYDQARALGVLDQAYLYGFDECRPSRFPALEQTAQLLRREFPEVLLMTTSYDHSYGLDSVVKTIDAWCPLTPSFRPDQVQRARATGRHVWWYICCDPHQPHANMFVENPAIEGRLLMGAMTAMQRPDGFLYYQISIWNAKQPITSGPFTDWDPRSWTTYHGDGAWTCVGPDGTPLPTVRLENFRDGLEDFAYTLILETIVQQVEDNPTGLSAADRAWLAEAKAALPVPRSLVRSLTQYSRQPADLYAWRNRIGDLIDRSGRTDVQPWPKPFGPRGLSGRILKEPGQ